MRVHSPFSSSADVARRSTRMLKVLLIGGLLLALLYSGVGAIVWRALLPVGLIALGLDLVTDGRQRRRIVPAALAALALLTPLVGGAELVDQRQVGQPRHAAGAIVDDVERLHVTLQLTAGSLRIAALDNSREPGVVARIDPADAAERAYRREGDEGRLEIGSGPFAGADYRLAIAPHVPTVWSIEMGAGDVGPLDFTHTQLQRLDLRLGAGSAAVRLPDRGAMQITVINSVGEVTIDVPEGLAARIEVRSRIGDVAVNDRFVLRDGVYVTDDYAPDAPDRAEITIASSVGTVRVR